jgi:hypothetical protein
VSGHSEPRIAQLLSALRPAPDAWVRAAQELPSVRRDLDVVADRDRALRNEDVSAHPEVAAARPRRLGAS